MEEKMMESEKDLMPPKKANVFKPKKDWLVVHNDFRLELKKGVEAEIPPLFIDVLKTEKVI